ncbi:heparinase II/III family protein [uncultured Muribaculum sp.]|uniref:heparinase II/III domain-containing protein n=1 Tax=uncultured Muribaculum sp. TaxID=1918613 RepID=UPI00266EAECF|nr:heparinase II/III family protein [uncultured Muribaculum sp.]
MKIRQVVKIGYVLFSKITKARPKAYCDRNFLQKEADFKKLKSSLVMKQKWVPYPDYDDRDGWNRFLGPYKNDYICRGEACRGYVWKVVKATDYMAYERSGDQSAMEAPYGENSRALQDLFMAELAEGKGRFVDQIINGVFHCCEMTTWALSAHLRLQKAKGYLPSHKEHVIDMGAGGLASLLAWIYYYLKPLFDKQNPLIAERLLSELQTRILDTYMNNNHFWWMAFDVTPRTRVNNWNPWCNFYVLQCFFLLENNRNRLAKAVYRTMISVDRFINYTQGDGACAEGPTYWSHAAGKLYDYLQLLYNGTAGAISIFDKPIVRNMGEYIVRSYVGSGWVVNFADASAKTPGNAELIFRYGKAVCSEVMTSHAACNRCVSGSETAPVGDIFRVFETLFYREEFYKVASVPNKKPVYVWYPETCFCYMTNQAGFFVAIKGGYNNESHNHNDVGTFSLYLNSIPVFIDVGVGTYTRKTFSNERYSIWTMQSDYHNLPMINGIPQCHGENYRATDVAFSPERMCLSMNIGKAYPFYANVKKWNRVYTLHENSLRIEDSFSLSKLSGANKINFLMWGKVDISEPGTIVVDIQGQRVMLEYEEELFEPTIETICIDDKQLSDVWGCQIYRVSLNALKQTLTGSYTYTITSAKSEI